MALRTGIGYDAHRLAGGRKLILGGVRIPYPKGLTGHSDADVIVHAVVDALLGAAGLPDIGSTFSDKDPRWRNVSSLVFLKEVARIFSKKRIRIENVDCALISESPKISGAIPRMKATVARALKISPSAVGIKASTNERMGFIGRKEGMACTAVALVRI